MTHALILPDFTLAACFGFEGCAYSALASRKSCLSLGFTLAQHFDQRVKLKLGHDFLNSPYLLIKS